MAEKLAAAHSTSPFLTVWDEVTETKESGWPTLAGSGTSVAFSPDGTRLAVAHSTTPFLTVVDTASKSAESGWPTFTATGRGVAWSPDGARLAFVNDSTQALSVIDVASKTTETGWPTFTSGGASNGRTVEFSPDGTRLAVVKSESTERLAVIDVASKTKETGWPNPASNSRGLAWSLDGARLVLAYGTSPGYVVYDTSSKTAETGWPTTGVSICEEVAFSADGSRFALALNSASPGYAVIDVASKTVETGWGALSGEGNLAQAVAFSPDDEWLAVSKNTATYVHLVDVATKTESTWLPGYVGTNVNCWAWGDVVSPTRGLLVGYMTLN